MFRVKDSGFWAEGFFHLQALIIVVSLANIPRPPQATFVVLTMNSSNYYNFYRTCFNDGLVWICFTSFTVATAIAIALNP